MGKWFGVRFKLFFIIISQYNPNVFPFKNQNKTFQIYRSITMWNILSLIHKRLHKKATHLSGNEEKL